MALTTSPESPAAVRTIAKAVGDWIDRLGSVWVEGQVAQLNRRPGATSVWLTLRDTEADMSLSVSCHARVLDSCVPPLAEGQRVVVHVQPEYYAVRGSLSFRADQIRPVGIGELLAQLEARKNLLAAEGLFDPARKKPLPFLPRAVGLVCGRGSDAERDVVENARRRWPGVVFEVREVAVQGVRAVSEVTAAVRELDSLPGVDVIVVTRGGGSVEDLLPFSDEGLVRAVAAAATPVVSAIGHEKDAPLLDLVADVRASTPTDAARRVVPDMGEQMRIVSDLRSRAERAVRGRLDQAQSWLDQARHRPVLADPSVLVTLRAEQVASLLERSRRSLDHRLVRAGDDVEHVRARVRALSPAATLDRGYAVVQTDDGAVVRDAEAVATGALLRVRVSQGELHARRED
ncbi:MAG TPA: exodeoxyribonuclease VII large subunit [Candidatus Nanopelagicales bacterium]|nr:exodeoxyribonuclease VII large subunit [Candidatus Nanopelagicales bacterium]